MISQTAEYALRAISLLAEHHPTPRKTQQIADAASIPKPYLVKVLQALSAQEIVETRRGVNGGVSLMRDLSELTMLDVINAVDPIQRITKCPIGLSAHGVKLCPMHSRLDAALEQIEKVMSETTLAEVLADQSNRVSCKFPRATVQQDITGISE